MDGTIVKRVTKWISIATGVPGSCIIIKEVQCTDINCVPVETMVILLDERSSVCTFKGKILMPLAEVTEQDVQELQISEQIALAEEKKERFRSVQTSVREYLDACEWNEDKLSALDSIQAFLDTCRSELQLAEPVMTDIGDERSDASSTNVTPMQDVTQIVMKSRKTTDGVTPPSYAAVNVPMARIVTSSERSSDDTTERHKKGGSRPRGCPCCDPDNLDNIVDKFLFLDTPR